MKYINIYIFKRNISDVYVYYVKVYCQCDFKVTPTIYFYIMNIYITYLFFLNLYIYIFHCYLLFIIYIRMYILQKKDKPRTAVQSIGPQTK